MGRGLFGRRWTARIASLCVGGQAVHGSGDARGQRDRVRADAVGRTVPGSDPAGVSVGNRVTHAAVGLSTVRWPRSESGIPRDATSAPSDIMGRTVPVPDFPASAGRTLSRRRRTRATRLIPGQDSAPALSGALPIPLPADAAGSDVGFRRVGPGGKHWSSLFCSVLGSAVSYTVCCKSRVMALRPVDRTPPPARWPGTFADNPVARPPGTTVPAVPHLSISHTCVSYLIACHEPKHANPPSVC